MKTMKPLIPLLLLLAVLVLTGAAAAEEENLIHPPESGVIVTGFTEIDSVQPDTAAAEAFMQSPVYNTVTDCLMQKDTPETLPEEILNLTLEDFPYHTADGEEMICSISVAELLNGMNTTFTGHGWGSSYQTHEYIEISVGDPAWKTDLINAWNFIQVMAQQNGFDNTIPVRFANIKITSGEDDPTPLASVLFSVPGISTTLTAEETLRLGQYQIAGIDSPTYGRLSISSSLLPTGNSTEDLKYELLYFDNLVPDTTDTIKLAFLLRGTAYSAELDKLPNELGEGMTGYAGTLAGEENTTVTAVVFGTNGIRMSVTLSDERITIEPVQSESKLKTTPHPLHVAYSSASLPDISGNASTGDKIEPLPPELQEQGSGNSTVTTAVPQQTTMPESTKSPVPLAGVLGGLGCAAVLAYVFRRT